ncbi:MAG TPA: hypothetical protein VLD63_07215 [Anaerolineales bacterium]|nr:hypothetical protein [Anaerolineales bacterium]
MYTRPLVGTRRTGGIAIVGPCASGKTTLARGLQALGHPARQIAQEHSYVPDMWQRLSRPDVLVFLDASYETCTTRKQLNWTRAEFAEQQRRLAHARQHCHLYIYSDALTVRQVLEATLQALGENRGLWPVAGGQ